MMLDVIMPTSMASAGRYIPPHRIVAVDWEHA